MGLIRCPECGTKISDKAISCPYCGYMSENKNLPISLQDTYEVTPRFNYDIAEWNPHRNDCNIISVEDNKKLVDYFANWETIQLKLPAIAQVIKEMATKDEILVAKMDSYVKTLIDKGIYHFTIDKNGEILPTIRDAEGFVKQVRLEKMEFSPELVNSLNNLSTHAAMAQILDEIEYIGDAIRGLHTELQNDRLALAESSRDKLLLASKMQDTKLREIALINATSSATDAKRVLMRNFTENLKYIEENTDKSDIELFFEGKKGKEIPQKVTDAFQALVSITNMVQIECEGYALLGEYEASKESLLQFKDFIEVNKLNDKDTLLLLNENTPLKKIKVVDEFMLISNKINNFDEKYALSSQDFLMINEGTDYEN